MGVGAIPLSEYVAYFGIFQVDTLEEQLDHILFVGVLDNEYLKYQNEKSEEEKDKKSKEKPLPNKRRR